MLPVTNQVNCQPPICMATAATSGGPANCPTQDHCCMKPTVVDTVAWLGARCMAVVNKVAGIRPPVAENSATATKRSHRGASGSPPIGT